MVGLAEFFLRGRQGTGTTNTGVPFSSDTLRQRRQQLYRRWGEGYSPMVPGSFPDDRMSGASQAPGARYLRTLGEQFVLPQVQAQGLQSGALNQMLFSSLQGDPGEAGLKYAQEATKAYAEDIGRPGGPIAQAIQQSLRGSVQSGFGPGGTGKTTSDAFGIAREGARSVSNFFTQQALTARGQGIQREATLGGLAGAQADRYLSLLGGLMGINMSAEQLGLQRWAINKQT